MEPKDEVVIEEDEIAEYLYNHLIMLGYAPDEDETADIAMLIFDYLIEKGVLEVDE